MADLAADDKVDATDTTSADTTTADEAPTGTTATAADDKTATTAADATADTAADDWRSRMAGSDEKALAWLGRYPSEADFLKDAKKRFDTVREGKLIKPLGDDPSESEVKAYREAMGVPDKPEGYLEKLSGGLVVGDDDRPIVDKFLGAMHEKHVPASTTDAVLQTYYKIVEEQDAAIADRVATAAQQCEDALREEWGGDYRRNLNATDSFVETLPADVQAAINEGFGPDGIPLKANVAVKKWLAGLALEANPLATVVPGAGANQASAIADEIAEIREVMRTDRARYNRDEKMQARYRELVGAQEKLKEQ